MKHKVAVHRIVPRIAAHRSIHYSAYVALLAENVVELQGYGSCILGEEALRYLGIPDEFIGIELRIAESATAVHSSIC